MRHKISFNSGGMNKSWSHHGAYFGIISAFYTCRVLNLGYDGNSNPLSINTLMMNSDPHVQSPTSQRRQMLIGGFNCLTLSSLFWVGFWGLLVKRICCGSEHIPPNICHMEVLAHNIMARGLDIISILLSDKLY